MHFMGLDRPARLQTHCSFTTPKIDGVFFLVSLAVMVVLLFIADSFIENNNAYFILEQIEQNSGQLKKKIGYIYSRY
jgi:hypothetical protein